MDGIGIHKVHYYQQSVHIVKAPIGIRRRDCNMNHLERQIVITIRSFRRLREERLLFPIYPNTQDIAQLMSDFKFATVDRKMRAMRTKGILIKAPIADKGRYWIKEDLEFTEAAQSSLGDFE